MGDIKLGFYTMAAWEAPAEPGVELSGGHSAGM